MADHHRPLFNPEGDRDPDRRRIIGGNSTRLIELNNIKYPWAVELYRTMLANFWIPEEIPLAKDAKDYRLLAPAEREGYNLTLSFLIFLDSIQTVNLPNLADYVTAPEISLCLTVQAFQEAVHSQSYAYILDTVADPLLRDMVYNFWREDAELRERNQVVVERYQAFLDDPSPENLLRSVVANAALEGIYFYSGFALFYALARTGRMMGTASVIRYIQRDETTHLHLFQQIFRGLLRENPDLQREALIRNAWAIFEEAVEQESRWGERVTAGVMPDLEPGTVGRFIRHLANQRMIGLGLDAPYPEVRETPYPWFDAFSSLNAQKTDFFEQRVLNYAKAPTMDWDSL